MPMNRFGLGEEPEVHEIKENVGDLTSEDIALVEADEILSSTFGPIEDYLSEEEYNSFTGKDLSELFFNEN